MFIENFMKKNDSFEAALKVLKHVRMSEHKKAQLRREIAHYAREHPVQIPLSLKIYDTFFTRFSTRYFAFHPSFALASLVLCISVGTSYAAQSALPGEALYAFKTNVNERLEGSLAISSVAKAAWSTQQAERRLQEAEILATEGRLTPVATASLERGFDIAMQNFDSSITLLATNDRHEENVADAQSSFEASLNAHSVVLNELAISSTSIDTNVQTLITRVKKRAKDANEARQKMELSLVEKTDEKAKSSALQQKRNAEKSLVAMRTLASSTDRLDATALASVEAVAAQAQQAITEGEEEIRKGNWGKAFGTFQSAVRNAQETKTNVDSRKLLNKDKKRGKSESKKSEEVSISSVATEVTATSTPVRSEKKSGKRDEDRDNDD
jgi:hypothetical protein